MENFHKNSESIYNEENEKLKSAFNIISLKDDNDVFKASDLFKRLNITLLSNKEKFKEKFPLKVEEIKLLEQVNLMTPENIHINSFMYEPILDMSIIHLKSLYKKIDNL